MENTGTDRIEVFELDDDFDPLEDMGFEQEEEEYAGGIEYQVPVIPDADRSVVPEPVVAPPAERIAKLIAGLPGQKFRILSGVRVCADPKTLEEAAADLEALYPQGTSVYPATRIIELLAEAGALERIDPDQPEDPDTPEDGAAEAAESSSVSPADDAAGDERIESISWDEADLEFDEVEPAEPSIYVATEAGLAAIEEHWSADAAAKVVADEPQYRTIYKRVLDLCAEPGGKTKVEIADEIDGDPLLQEPRRWCQYFLEKLRETNALEWDGTWTVTDIGANLLASDLFADMQTTEESEG